MAPAPPPAPRPIPPLPLRIVTFTTRHHFRLWRPRVVNVTVRRLRKLTTVTHFCFKVKEFSESCETFAISIFRFSDVPRNSFTLKQKCVTVVNFQRRRTVTSYFTQRNSHRTLLGGVPPTMAPKVFSTSSQKHVSLIESEGFDFPKIKAARFNQ